MDRQELIGFLSEYKTKYNEEQKHVARFLDLLTYDNCYERSLSFGHVTASSWILHPDRNQVLLLHHKKLDKWLQPGGHADGEENVLKVAKKEMSEETGVSKFELLIDTVFDIDIHHIPARKEDEAHEHFDVRFAFVSETGHFLKNEESNELKWVALDQLEDYVGTEQSILRMRDKTLAIG